MPRPSDHAGNVSHMSVTRHHQLAAFDHYDYGEDGPELPDDPAPTHCVRITEYIRPDGRPYRTKRPHRPSFLMHGDYELSWCGQRIKVLLPIDFDPDDNDACPGCVDAMNGDEAYPTKQYRPNEWDREPEPVADEELDEAERLAEVERTVRDERLAQERRERNARHKAAYERRQAERERRTD